MTVEQTGPSPAVGARRARELETLLIAGSPVESCSERYRRGVLDALGWAHGGLAAAPITVTALPGAVGPSREGVLAECQAAWEELLGSTRRTVALDYARGVHEALTRVCADAAPPH
ncbi:hypothetical protein OG871_07025 [Kitasatospora sp. NBC_00374]|uniref:hypothetical protein n=1 Tax=Kitasatospora sp. NBC_00374 TaxID=2975964 RepID=UPI003251524C